MLYVEQARNLTLHLPADLIRRTKVYAAQRDTSINQLVRELLEETVSDHGRIREAGARILEIAENGPYSPVDPGTIRRDDLYERW